MVPVHILDAEDVALHHVLVSATRPKTKLCASVDGRYLYLIYMGRTYAISTTALMREWIERLKMFGPDIRMNGRVH